ncbi:MAG: sn-glycerol-1-phosphate dehydrogenase [Victivallales bacterium]|nr:sn-glycerol-1-phosphate dehydrogenase [Victivallales bacterium]
MLNEIPAILGKLWAPGTVILVADTNTWAVVGEKVQQVLEEAGISMASPKIFPGQPILPPDYRFVQELIPLLKGRIPIAVGSGVINDLVKCASTEAGCAGYMVVGTACSVDGYTSYGAALVVDGFKKTVPCAAPLAVLADSRILATAPSAMAASGYADMLAKVVSGADWHIAATLGITPYNETAWQMTQVKLRQWVGDPEGIAAANPAALANLFEGLAATGFAMQLMHDSRPASGAEHLLSHVWEMDGVTFQGEHPSHGFKVGIGILMVVSLMEHVFSKSKKEIAEICAKAPLVSAEQRLAEINYALAGTAILEQVKRVSLEKLPNQQALQERLSCIVEKWEVMKKLVLNQIFPFQEIRRRMKVVGCPVHPSGIGVDRSEMRRAVICAQMIRNRYTILDLLYDMGILEQSMEAVMDKVFE